MLELDGVLEVPVEIVDVLDPPERAQPRRPLLDNGSFHTTETGRRSVV
jgi:hypothetical protein